MGERKAVEDRAHLRRDRLLVDVATPHRLPGLHDELTRSRRPSANDDVDAVVARLDFDVDARRAEQYSALQIEGPAPAGAKLPGNARLRTLWT